MGKSKYEIDRNGLRELARTSGIQQAAIDGGRGVAADAKAFNPRGDYEVTAATVTAGWQNEQRAGAAVNEVEVGRGPQKRALFRAAW